MPSTRWLGGGLVSLAVALGAGVAHQYGFGIMAAADCLFACGVALGLYSRAAE